MAPPSRPYPWKTFAFLVAAGTLTSPLVIPYFRGLEAIAPGPQPTVSLGTLVLSGLIRSLILLVPAAGIGLLVAPKIGLGAPYLESWLDGGPRPAEPFSSIVWPAIVWATVTALVAFGIDAIFRYGLGVTFPAPEIHARIAVPWWRSGLASFWAPWAEEIFDRLFLLSLVAWLGMKLFRVSEEGRGREIALWVAILATALFFGWYHISNEEMFANPVPSIVQLRTVLIILPVGLAFGWLYIRRGLEAVILSHFVIDLIVHAVRPIVEHGLGLG
ncbi:MAG TPA: CPBP family intramembrane glutamic endopeptidase [Thermoanaerobaculia bacterium]|nr:CPBP family intramembrane glutamic endopeptidase [Thermoanaerobaculia bacterium]